MNEIRPNRPLSDNDIGHIFDEAWAIMRFCGDNLRSAFDPHSNYVNFAGKIGAEDDNDPFWNELKEVSEGWTSSLKTEYMTPDPIAWFLTLIGQDCEPAVVTTNFLNYLEDYPGQKGRFRQDVVAPNISLLTIARDAMRVVGWFSGIKGQHSTPELCTKSTCGFHGWREGTVAIVTKSHRQKVIEAFAPEAWFADDEPAGVEARLTFNKLCEELEFDNDAVRKVKDMLQEITKDMQHLEPVSMQHTDDVLMSIEYDAEDDPTDFSDLSAYPSLMEVNPVQDGDNEGRADGESDDVQDADKENVGTMIASDASEHGPQINKPEENAAKSTLRVDNSATSSETLVRAFPQPTKRKVQPTPKPRKQISKRPADAFKGAVAEIHPLWGREWIFRHDDREEFELWQRILPKKRDQEQKRHLKWKHFLRAMTSEPFSFVLERRGVESMFRGRFDGRQHSVNLHMPHGDTINRKVLDRYRRQLKYRLSLDPEKLILLDARGRRIR